MSQQSDLLFGDAVEAAPGVRRADDLPAAFANLPAAWRRVLDAWTPVAERAVTEAVRAVSGEREIAPPDPFRALRLLAPEEVRVVVFGQDPYPRPGHADGLAFSAGHGKPVSLRRIFDILKADRPGWLPPERWLLDGWARQGVLMLNPVLTVEVGSAGAHMGCGWQALTADIVRVLAPRHPSHDFKREFMADGSHFAATAKDVDWWSLE
jgi:uracil-DNA glycosylase